MINKKSITKISSGLLIGLGLITLQQNPSSVSAASSPRVQLRHNSYVYSSTGKRKGKASLKRGTYLKTFGKRSIKGKAFYKIGKGRYIKKVNTVIPPKEDKDPVLFTVYLKDDAEFYTKPNGKHSLYTLMGKQNVYQTYKDNNGNTWYRIKYQNWVKSSDTQKSKIKEDKEVPTSANWDDPNDNTSIEVEEEMKSNLPSGTALDRNTIEETARCFEKLVNDWRASQGVATKVTYVTSRYDYDVSRAVQNAQHYDKYKVSDKHAGAKYGELETLVTYNAPQKMAQEAFKQFVYEDAPSNFAHRDILKYTSLKTIGIGLATTYYNSHDPNGVIFMVSTTRYFN
ncbi:SLAP domain-containing protein [Lactobacillus sp.]|uniref:SLAP domain-containing protein n=1 Tax=Lactobacillus sp. TaxID=1591 RepID=UPI0025CB77CB|nr:SLAP domain-containing protein [Lactobacillus sp.]MCO6535847.1 SLAP domain-containing protein [Lactobacillus sp.]